MWWVSPTHLPCLTWMLTLETGELFTWGKAGPHLGYTVSGNKQLEPRHVEELAGSKVKYVACGALHTIGQLMWTR